MSARRTAGVLLIVLALALLVVLVLVERAPSGREDAPPPQHRGRDGSSGAPPGPTARAAPWIDPLLHPDSPEFRSARPADLCAHQQAVLQAIDPDILALTFSPSPARPLFDGPQWLQLGDVWVPVPARDYQLRLVGRADRFSIGLVASDVVVMVSEPMAALPLDAPGMPSATSLRDVLFEAYAVDGTRVDCDPATPADSARVAVALAVKPLFARADDERVSVHADTAADEVIAWIHTGGDAIRLELAMPAAQVIIEQTAGDDLLAVPAGLRTSLPGSGEVLRDVSALWAGDPAAGRRLLTSGRPLAPDSRRLLEELATRPRASRPAGHDP